LVAKEEIKGIAKEKCSRNNHLSNNASSETQIIGTKKELNMYGRNKRVLDNGKSTNN
jgi:hypothetical protein